MSIKLHTAIQILARYGLTLTQFLTEESRTGIPGALNEDGTVSLERLRTYLGY